MLNDNFSNCEEIELYYYETIHEELLGSTVEMSSREKEGKWKKIREQILVQETMLHANNDDDDIEMRRVTEEEQGHRKARGRRKTEHGAKGGA